MIAEKYQNEFLKQVKRIDILLANDSEFEKLANEIIEAKSERAILEFWKKISDSPLPDTKKKDARDSLYSYLGVEKFERIFESFRKQSNIPLPELLGQLNDLVGLKNVKQQVSDLISFAKIQKLREDNGLKKSRETLHMAFLGNPGTAKTTVARIVGRMYKSMGLLSKGHFIEASRADLIAEYQGQTAIKVKKLIQRAKGGVLFIDEAYSITENENTDSYGRESLTELTKALEDYRDDLVVIVAGYSNLMKKFFESNPGLKSRFNTFIQFEDYSLDELIKIFKYDCEKYEYNVSEEILSKAKEYIEHELNEKDENFSNGRMIRNLFDDVIMRQSKRLTALTSEISKEQLSQITESDIPLVLEDNQD
ncbi:MAG: AAA family ATPase [Streptococcaceae bacterium]|nr:AAA family ATPase [Streptococcaceae bacterium]MCL2680980.1 AAA family ATPase [Streptococcaceae bacterium]